ncbi:MAG: hypothetical protein U1E67_15340 [Hyphomicrobiales bacterium]
MKVKIIKVIPVVLASWRAGFSAVVATLPLFLVTVVVMITTGAGRLSLPTWPLMRDLIWPNYPALTAVFTVTALVEAIVLAVLMIAIQRFLLLSERPSRAGLAANPRRTLRYAAYLAIPLVISRLYSIMVFALKPLEVTADWQLASLQALLFTFAILPFLLLCLMSILFPAIAIDARAATLRNALADSRRGLWRILLVQFGTALPILILLGVTMSVMRGSSVQVAGGMVVFLVVASMAAYAACCTYVYRGYAQALASLANAAQSDQQSKSLR